MTNLSCLKYSVEQQACLQEGDQKLHFEIFQRTHETEKLLGAISCAALANTAASLLRLCAVVQQCMVLGFKMISVD